MAMTGFLMFISFVHQIFIDYETWTTVEIDGIFEGLVWPQLGKLSTDMYDSPGPLLKFFLEVTKNHR